MPRFLKLLYLKLFRIHDTPQKIAGGLGLGVFMGILPGTGPLAALVLSLLLKVNRAAALLGSLITNTWLSIVTFLLAVKIGGRIMNLDWHKLQEQWLHLLKNFHWASLFQPSVIGITVPVIIGYFIIAFCLGLAVYLIALLVLTITKKKI
ncbi:MAG: hypothetical protein A2166_00245 [Omnitrophica WOR_2 bacterium RBG_13_41_10]|nr:MAG: hypothetical protein A2166_00245 [Omnitrophica WOR_2 bacterium RBG_13_41_10]